MIFYIVIIKFGFCMFAKKGKECSCNLQRYVFIFGGAVDLQLENLNVRAAEPRVHVRILSQRIMFLHLRCKLFVIGG